MADLEYEKLTTSSVIANAIDYAEDKGIVQVKKLAHKLGVSLSTSAKVIAVLRLKGVLGAETKKGYPFIEKKSIGNTSTTLIVEKIKDGEEYSNTYFDNLLVPAVKTAFEWGNIGVNMLERKLNLAYLRSQDIYDLLDSAGILGEESEINPGRRMLAMTPSEFDKLMTK